MMKKNTILLHVYNYEVMLMKKQLKEIGMSFDDIVNADTKTQAYLKRQLGFDPQIFSLVPGDISELYVNLDNVFAFEKPIQLPSFDEGIKAFPVYDSIDRTKAMWVSADDWNNFIVWFQKEPELL